MKILYIVKPDVVHFLLSFSLKRPQICNSEICLTDNVYFKAFIRRDSFEHWTPWNFVVITITDIYSLSLLSSGP